MGLSKSENTYIQYNYATWETIQTIKTNANYEIEFLLYE